MEAGEKPELIIHADLGQLHLDVNALVKLEKETNGWRERHHSIDQLLDSNLDVECSEHRQYQLHL